MQNSIDRQRLLRRCGQEPSSPATVIAKCAAGIAILIGILLISLNTPDSNVGKQAQTSTTPVTDIATQYPSTAAAGASN